MPNDGAEGEDHYCPQGKAPLLRQGRSPCSLQKGVPDLVSKIPYILLLFLLGTAQAQDTTKVLIDLSAWTLIERVSSGPNQFELRRSPTENGCIAISVLVKGNILYSNISCSPIRCFQSVRLFASGWPYNFTGPVDSCVDFLNLASVYDKAKRVDLINIK